MGSLFVTVSVDDDGDPFEVFGYLGKGGSFQHGVTELACRLISLHLRRGTPVEEVIDQMQGIQEMQPFWNQMGDGRSVPVHGLGDGIAHILKVHLKAREERQTTQAEEVQAAAWAGLTTESRRGCLLHGRPRFSLIGRRRRRW